MLHLVRERARQKFEDKDEKCETQVSVEHEANLDLREKDNGNNKWYEWDNGKLN